MDSEPSTCSRLPALIIMKISCGGCSQALPRGQEPAQTPHCMHILTHSPSSTFASTSFRKLLRYCSIIAVFKSLISDPLELERAQADLLDGLSHIVDQFGRAFDISDRHLVDLDPLRFQIEGLQGVADLAHPFVGHG